MSGTIVEADAKRLHEELQAMFLNNEKRDRPTVVTLFSLHDGPGGQWIIGDKHQDAETLARRLRLAADILEGKAAEAAALTHG